MVDNRSPACILPSGCGVFVAPASRRHSCSALQDAFEKQPNRNLFLEIAIILSILFISFTPILQAEDPPPDGKILLKLERQADGYSITSATIVPRAEPLPFDEGEIDFSIIAKDGTTLKTGKTTIPQYVFHDKPLANGDLTGFRTPIDGAAVITLPYYTAAERFCLTRPGGSLIAERRLRDIPTRRSDPGASRRPAAPSLSPPPDYRGYISSLDIPSKPDKALSARARSQTAASDIDITIKVEVESADDPDALSVAVTFYRYNDGAETETVSSRNTARFSAKLPGGKYLVRAWCDYHDPAVQGAPVPLYPYPRITEFDTASGTLLLKWKLNPLFQGQTKARKGLPVLSTVYIFESAPVVSTHQRAIAFLVNTDENGRFAVRLPSRKYLFFVLPGNQENAGESLFIKRVPKAPKKTTSFICAPLGENSEPPLQQIWGRKNAKKRLNLIFLAEAYTDAHESFTDENGNGRWDGDMLLDENGNGKLDPKEYYFDRNRNGAYDKPEPFDDANGDRICNRYERARFHFDAALAAVSLLNFKPFDRYSGRINIYTYWSPSVHGTQSFLGFKKPWRMDTALNSSCNGRGGFQPGQVASYDVYNLAAEALPDYTIPIVMVHDPFNALRANAVLNFGRILLSAEDSRAGTVLIHEMGHSLGGLWDEYIYQKNSVYFGGEPSGANVTIDTDPLKVKWRELIDGNIPVPTPFAYDGYGIFTGASYEYGIYRPTANSMMRATSYPFFKVNEARLISSLRKFKK